MERTLNRIIDAINRQEPIQSATVAVEQTPNGILLKVISIQQVVAPTAGGGTGSAAPTPPAPSVYSGIVPHFPPPGYANWYQVTARADYDPQTQLPRKITFMYFGTAPSPTKWHQ